MLVREIQQNELRDEDFEAERENIFFLPSRGEVKLRCRRNSVQKRTYVSETDFLRLQPRDQAEFQANRANPRGFYCDGEARRPANPAAKKTKRSKADRAIAKTGRLYGRGFSLGSPLGEFIYCEMKDLPEFSYKEVESGVIPFYRDTLTRMDRDSVLALQEKLETERELQLAGGGGDDE